MPANRTKRQRTRAALIEAAAQVIFEKGYERTSLEAVAARAGMTRGAIYGNFANKEELFLAVIATKWQPIVPPFKPLGSFADQMEMLANAVVDAMPARREIAVGAASFQLYALTHEDMKQRIAVANADIYRRMAAELHRLDPTGLPMPPETLVRVLHALIDGLTFLHALTPELIDANVIRAAIRGVGAASTAN